MKGLLTCYTEKAKVNEKKRELICCRRHTIRIGAALKSNGKKWSFMVHHLMWYCMLDKAIFQ
jgi:hypothetical protein